MTKLGLFFVTLFGLLLLACMPVTAQAKDKAVGCDAACQAWKSGVGSKPGPKATCTVRISADTFGGEVGLDIRDANRDSRFPEGKPRIKPNVPPGTVTFIVGCDWLGELTAEVYECANGVDGKQYSSILWRSKGQLDAVLKTHRLELCLKGDQCTDYVPGPPPPH